MTPDFAAYLHGRGQGLVQYCRPPNGYALGARGQAYRGVCPESLEAPFVAAHADGMGLYERHRAVKRAAKRLYRAEARARRIEHLLVEKTQALISPKTRPQSRLSLALDLKQLTEKRSRSSTRSTAWRTITPPPSRNTRTTAPGTATRAARAGLATLDQAAR